MPKYLISETIQVPPNEPITGCRADEFVQDALPVRIVEAASPREAFDTTCVDVPLTDEVWLRSALAFEGMTVFRSLDAEVHIVELNS